MRVCSWLCDFYVHIYMRGCAATDRDHTCMQIPDFRASGMTKRTQASSTGRKFARKISKMTTRLLGLVSWRKIIDEAVRRSRFRPVEDELERTVVFIITERLTSKCCCRCGQRNEGLSGSRVFKCPHCGAPAMSRDFQALTNMLRFNTSKSML